MSYLFDQFVPRAFLPGILFCLGSCSCLLAQDTVGIQDVEVTARKLSLLSAGKKVETIDSALCAQFRFGTVTEMLMYNSAFFIRQYGNGNIAAVTMRGASAEQSSVLWNGMNIQNTMLGQSDLSMVPAVFFDEVSVEYGGSSAAWGSGSMGGSIHLGSRVGSDGFRCSVAGSYASLNQLNTSAVVTAASGKTSNNLKLYMTDSRNNFRFRYPSAAPSSVMRAAPFKAGGIINEFRWFPASRHRIAANVWLSNANRALAGSAPDFAGRKSQQDEASRFQLEYRYNTNRYKGVLRGGYFNEAIHYNDTILALYTDNRAQVVQVDNENFLSLSNNSQLHAALSYLNTWGLTQNYEGRRFIRRISVMAGNKTALLKGRLLFSLNARAEVYSSGNKPLTGNAGIEWKPWKRFSVGATFARVYRHPTLNEMFWTPGGNSNLRPEQGNSVDVLAKYKRSWHTMFMQLSASAFSRNVHDWILWLPGLGLITTPVNVQSVWSRGAETRLSVSVKKQKWSTGATIQTSYVLSTVERSVLRSAVSRGKQLIYTPRYTASGNVFLHHRSTSVYLFYQYVGYRFTTSDNSAWLDPYHLLSLRINQKLTFHAATVLLFGAANNLLNSDYMVIDGAPMPLINFEGGITLHFERRKKSQN